MPTNRITQYADPKSEALWHAYREQKRLHAHELRRSQQWSYEEGYATGWVHASLVILGTMVAVGIWKAL